MPSNVAKSRVLSGHSTQTQGRQGTRPLYPVSDPIVSVYGAHERLPHEVET